MQMNRLHRSLRKLGIKRGDVIVFVSLMALSLILGFLFAVHQPKPEYVSVRVDGMEITRLPLYIDRVYKISDDNIIEISGGSVRMTYATCPDKICVKTGAISDSQHSIVCAPHKVVILITGGRDDQSYDAITN